MSDEEAMTIIACNHRGRICVKVWRTDHIHEWDIGFAISTEEALDLARQLQEAVALGPRVMCAADIGLDQQTVS